jgi:hypothetical protein
MKKHDLFMGMSALVLAFGFVLMGCSSDDETPTDETPSIGIATTGFDALTVRSLSGDTATFFSELKSEVKNEQLVGTTFKDYWYATDTNKAKFNAFGGTAVTWNHSSDTSGIWADTALNERPAGSPYYDWDLFGLVRVDITLVSGTQANAYLLYHDDDRTFDGINTGFMGYYLGSKMTGATGINQAQGGLSFGATAAGTYVVKLDVNKVDPHTGAVVETLATQTLTFTAN